MRSGGNVSTLSNNVPVELQAAAASTSPHLDLDDESLSESKSGQGGKCKGATTIPIFLKSESDGAFSSDSASLRCSGHFYFRRLCNIADCGC
jgi:hypothetical protein